MIRPFPGTWIVAVLLAVALTIWSALYVRVGATYVVEGEAWCPTAAPCTVRTLGAGFPLPYQADDPRISVPGSLGIEDDFRPGAFLVDVLFWLVVIAVVIQIVNYRRRKRVEADPSWDADRRLR